MFSKKILIIDDEPDILEIIKERLVTVGYEVATAANGSEGLSQIIIFDPDLIILDTLMPVMNGMQFMQKYEESDKMRKIPVIVISAKENVRDFFEDMLIQEFMVKPLDLAVLLTKIEQLIGKKEAAVTAATTSKRLLLVGVDKFIQNKIAEFFKSAGWEVSLANNDKQAYKTALTFYPDAILCQYWNPEWEGGELDTRQLKKRLTEDHSLARIHFEVYCSFGGVMEAMEAFPESELIQYKESGDLLKAVARRFGIYNR